MIKFKHLMMATLCAIVIPLLFSACKKDKENDLEMLTPGPDLNFYALTADNKLLLINAKNPSSAMETASIFGLQTGENILGIDFRPATGQLYGVGSSSRIYVIDPKSGAARSISAAAFTPELSGTSVGFDFNPTVDRIRLVSDAGQNLRLNPETGTVAATDLNINGVTNAKVTSVAYTQNKAGATATVLYDIDATTDKLYKQDPPNDGKLVEVGSLGHDVEEAGGFDINPDGTAALAALSVAGKQALYAIDINSGKAAKIGNLPANVTGLAIPTEPVAYAVSTTNELLIFNPMAATPMISVKAISGIQTGESILGIDFRPLNGQLYALGSTSRIYTINASSGVAAAVGTAPLATLLNGTQFGFDFNPTVDRIRIVSNLGQNLRVNPADGTLTVDGNITLATANVSGAAYTNNFAGATTTVLYDIDSAGDRLYKQDPPNNGTLVDVGALGINVESNNGFDIGGTSGLAYGLFTVGGVQKIYSVNLTTGAATAGPTVANPARGFALGLGF
ncbi:DUF4394 domain-containing protein [Sphingobacterium hungaricum]|uniref:DUF4394 domain-containing protein n=1 Tax=Sphingobacterium hungaricum TaxID=2082723 RepID=A0A928UXW7_9SPHI|nr:DUF4394 domain-containing protein [Sphingobacterium hungaricum]MBE8714712.1 hypothetical protein [Sphingobacterium hungaricum]